MCTRSVWVNALGVFFSQDQRPPQRASLKDGDLVQSQAAKECGRAVWAHDNQSARDPAARDRAVASGAGGEAGQGCPGHAEGGGLQRTRGRLGACRCRQGEEMRSSGSWHSQRTNSAVLDWNKLVFSRCVTLNIRLDRRTPQFPHL